MGRSLRTIPLTEREQKIWFERATTNGLQATRHRFRKRAHRYGPFKEAFGNRMIFVYATKGTAEENAWAYAKARFDAETWWYRGNGSVDVVPDTEFNAAKDRLAAWSFTEMPTTTRPGPRCWRKAPCRCGRSREDRRSRTAGRRPRLSFLPASTGERSRLGRGNQRFGCRRAETDDRVPYFRAGVAYPDCTVFGTETWPRASMACA